MDAALPAQLLDLGTREYRDVWQLQLDLVAARQRDEIPDTLVLVEHPHVITLGRRTRRENLLDTTKIPIVEIERGGDVTYHGPGQLVGYPIFLLREGDRDLHQYLRRMEQAIIETVNLFGIEAVRKAGWTGVWTPSHQGELKLASIGVAVKKWVTMHGFALNVSTALDRFAAINPCGLEASVMTSMTNRLGRDVPMNDVRAAIARQFGTVFGRRFA